MAAKNPNECLTEEMKGYILGTTGVQRQGEMEVLLGTIRECPEHVNKETKEVSGMDGEAKVKVKRKPSAFNLFMKDCLGKHKGEGKGREAHKENFKKCVWEWKARK